MTSIEWTHAPGYIGEVWNPTIGCKEISPGCQHCYACAMAHRGMQEAHRGLTIVTPSRGARWNGTVRTLPDRLPEPMRWRKPRMVFVDSMSDLFYEAIPFDFLVSVFCMMASCPQHQFLVLTKRGGYMRRIIHDVGKRVQAVSNKIPWPLPNVGLGVSVEDVERKDRIVELREVPAALRFLSLEPLLEDLGEIDLEGIDWVIVGGESGHGARVCFVDWIRNIVAQCNAEKTPVFVKQLGAHVCESPKHPAGIAREIVVTGKGGNPDEWPEDLRVREWPEVTHG